MQFSILSCYHAAHCPQNANKLGGLEGFGDACPAPLESVSDSAQLATAIDAAPSVLIVCARFAVRIPAADSLPEVLYCIARLALGSPNSLYRQRNLVSEHVFDVLSLVSKHI
jgi:hypothetical protein